MKTLLLLLQSFLEIFDRVARMFQVSPEERLEEIEKKNLEEKKEVARTGRPKWEE